MCFGESEITCNTLSQKGEGDRAMRGRKGHKTKIIVKPNAHNKKTKAIALVFCVSECYMG